MSETVGSEEVFTKSRSHLRVKLHLFFQYLGHLNGSEILNPSPLNQQPEKQKMTLGVQLPISNRMRSSSNAKKPSDDSVILVLGYGFKSRINRHPLTVGSL